MPFEIAAGITSARHGSELLKTLREMLMRPEVNHLEVVNRLMEIQGLILDAQTALIDAQTEKQKLTDENRELKRLKDFGAEFAFEEGVYWHRDYPYCPNCWEADGKPTRLAGPYRPEYSRDTQRDWICPVHNVTHTLSYR